MTEVPAPGPGALRGARRLAIIAIIASLSITALIGIFTLLTGQFGDTQWKILSTTLLMAGFSITSLCHLAVVGRTLRAVGYVGIAVSAVALISGVTLVWRNSDDFEVFENILKAFLVFSILAISLAHANLLLLLGQRKRAIIRYGLLATVGFIAIVATMLIIPIVTEGEVPGDDGDTYWRIFGVVAILDVLGTIVLPVLSRFVRDEPGPGATGTVLRIPISPELDAKLTEIATARSTTTEQVVLDALAKLAKPAKPAKPAK